MHTESTRKQIHDYVVDNFLFGSGDVEDDASLLDEGVLDSTGALELVFFLEKHFGLDVNDDEVAPENFDSINALVAYVERKGTSAHDESSR